MEGGVIYRSMWISEFGASISIRGSLGCTILSLKLLLTYTQARGYAVYILGMVGFGSYW